MADINDFANLILQINGILNYIIVRKDGHILSHNCKNPKILSPFIIFSGLSCDVVIKPAMGLTYFKYLIYTCNNNEKLLIFPMEKYFIGILHHMDAYTPDIVEEVTELLELMDQNESQ